ncbi:MAG: hypothetical protein IIV87_01980, partial [Oscillospiraceae bacterium]|nr:hypothetical protein [Oscillospiraceae bacterium]
MPRVMRNYEHADFSELLNEMHSENVSEELFSDMAASKTMAAAEVSTARRRRDSLLGNRKMRYAYSAKKFVLHDRACRHVNAIRDEDFEMLSEFCLSMPLCEECFYTAVLRSAIDYDDEKYIDAYVNIFQRFGADTKELYRLLIENHARLFDVT